MNPKTYHIFFETLANKLKMDIVLALLEKPMSVTELHNSLGVEQSKVSHALRILLLCRIVEVKQEGKSRIYTLNKATIVPLLKLVEKHEKQFCKYCQRACKK